MAKRRTTAPPRAPGIPRTAQVVEALFHVEHLIPLPPISPKSPQRLSTYTAVVHVPRETLP